VTCPNKSRPTWVTCNPDETIATLASAIVQREGLAPPIDIIYDDAVLYPNDTIRTVLKDEAVLLVELH